MKRYVLALDQGTTSSRAILFDHRGNIVRIAQQEFTQIYPKPGWVEHNPNEIFDSQLAVAQECVRAANIPLEEIAASLAMPETSYSVSAALTSNQQ